MIVVIFEASPKEENKQEFIEMGAKLKPMMEEIDGFIGIERFASLQDSNKLLSLSYWRDEKSVENWQKKLNQLIDQVAGADQIFSNYRMRIGNIIQDQGIQGKD